MKWDRNVYSVGNFNVGNVLGYFPKINSKFKAFLKIIFVKVRS